MRPVLCIATGQSCVRLLPLGDAERGDIWSSPWQAAEMLQAARIHRLATRTGSSGEVYAASWGEGLWFSRDGGRRWSNAPIEIRGSRVHCVSAASSSSAGGSELALQVLVGSEHGILKRATPDERGDLRSWELLDNLWLVPSSTAWNARPEGGTIRDVAANPRHEEWILAAVEGAGVLFSSDGGFSWDDARAGTDPSTRRLLWHPEHAERALALAPDTLRLSDDGGWNWRDAASPVPQPQAAVPLPQGRWLLAGQANGAAEVWVGDGLSAESWVLTKRFESRTQSDSQSGAQSGARIESLRTAPDRNEGAVWLAAWSDGSIEISRDEGRSWRALLIEGAPISAALDIVLAQAADEEDEANQAEIAEAEAKKAGTDARRGSGFTEDGKFWRSLLDKAGGRV